MVKRTALCATVFGALGGLALLGLAGCDGHPAATPARIEAVQETPVRTERASFSTAQPERRTAWAETQERAPAPQFRGKPMWADNRNHTAEENAKYQFEQHGEELGAKSLDDFLAKAHAFVAEPPKGVLTKTRANGDVLMYDPASGVFAVAREDGAPRTVFKPNDGEAYWRSQDTGERRAAASRRSSGDEG